MLVNQPAVDFELRDVRGQVHRLDDFRGAWLLLVFHRHLAWLPCREHLSQLRQQQSRFMELDTQIVVVTFESEYFAKAYADETQLDWPILLDTERRLYRGYGMDRGRWWNLAGPAAIWIYLKLMFRGRRVRMAHDDVKQLGGDVLIDPQGIVRLHHVGNGPADRPPVQTLLRTIEASE